MKMMFHIRYIGRKEVKKENTIKIHVAVTQSIHKLNTNKSPDTHQLLI